MISVIGIASGVGGSHQGSMEGPLLLKEKWKSKVNWIEMIVPSSNPSDKKKEILSLNTRLAEAVAKSFKEDPYTIVIGGDHSCGIGTWSGVSSVLAEDNQDLGLIWIDAHMDSHTMETSPSGNIHGMPVASLLGQGAPDLAQILSSEPKVKPENLFFVGIRSFEKEEKELAEKLGIRVYYIEEVLERGLKTVLSEILSYFKQKGIQYGISLDIDFFDPKEMSATGTPEENGTHPDEFLGCFHILEDNPPILFEYVEFNPPRDTEGKSLKWSIEILQKVVEMQQAKRDELIAIKH